MLRLALASIVVAIACLGRESTSDSPVAEPPKIYFGLLHAHTAFSDGSGTPEEAFAAARQAGLDFFAITEHNHAAAESFAKERKDGLLIATNPQLYSSTTPLTVTRHWTDNGQQKSETLTNVKSVIQAAHDATTPTFLPIYGQEFSTISSGNHVNVFQVNDVLTVPNGNFRSLFQTLATLAAAPQALPVVVQMNHPDVHKDLFYGGSDADTKKYMKNDYGIDDGDLGPSFQSLVGVEDRFVHLIEVLSGPALSPVPIPYDVYEDDYYFYLCQGLHLSPSAGQDNHYKTWGTITDARTGVLAESLTLPAILSAMEMNRTFATQDKNLKVILKLTAEGHSHVMGDTVSLADDAELTFTVSLEDGDEPATHYVVQLVKGLVAPGDRDAVHELKVADGLGGAAKSRDGNGDIVFSGEQTSTAPQFFFVRVTQSDGNRAWTAPIWVNYPRAWGETTTVEETFVWSARSGAKVYHVASCPSAKAISTTNRQTGPTPPQGKQPHSCVTDSGGGDH